MARVAIIIILSCASLTAAPPYVLTGTTDTANISLLNAMLYDLYTRKSATIQLAPDGAAIPGMAVESTDSRLRRIASGVWGDIRCTNLYADDTVTARRGLFGGYVDPSTDTLHVRGSSLLSGTVWVDGRLGVGVAPQNDTVVAVRQRSVPYAWRVNTNTDVATNLCGIDCAGAWGVSGIYANNAYPSAYAIYGAYGGVGADAVYTPLIAPRKSGSDNHVRISTAVAIDPHGDFIGTTIGLLELRSSNKPTALYIEGSYTGVEIASGRTIGIDDSATYSRHRGYLLVDSRITTPIVGNSTSPFTIDGSSITIRNGSRFVGINGSGIILSDNGSAIQLNTTDGITHSVGGNEKLRVASCGNVHITRTDASGIGYWIDASTSYRWGVYRDASNNLALRGNDASTDGLAVCPSSVVVKSCVVVSSDNNKPSFKASKDGSRVDAVPFLDVSISSEHVCTWGDDRKLFFNSVGIDNFNRLNTTDGTYSIPLTGWYDVRVFVHGVSTGTSYPTCGTEVKIKSTNLGEIVVLQRSIEYDFAEGFSLSTFLYFTAGDEVYITVTPGLYQWFTVDPSATRTFWRMRYIGKLSE